MTYDLQTFFETSKVYRGGKSVWVKDSNGESRSNTLLGSTIANPPKGLIGHLFAAQLYQYTMGAQYGYIFRSFGVKTASAADAKTIVLNADGYSDNPEVGMVFIKAPDSLTKDTYTMDANSGTKQKVKITFTAGCETNGNIVIGLDGKETTVPITTASDTPAKVAAVIAAATYANYTVIYTATNAYVEFEANTYGTRAEAVLEVASTGVVGTILEEVNGSLGILKVTTDTVGQSGKVTAVVYDSDAQTFTVTLDTAIGALTTDDIIVEATGTEASSTAKVLVPKPNTFVEVDKDLMPTASVYGISNVSLAISTIYDKKAFIGRMQPLPKYILANNRSLIDGIYWI